MTESLVKELEAVGLSDKEARVYLAGLELGPATAQQLAAKATVNRPTTYIAVESLIKRGLMSSFQKGKRRYFNAGAPNQLLYIIQNKKRLLLENEKHVEKLIGELGNRFSTKADQHAVPVRTLEGVAGLQVFQQEVLASGAAEILELTPGRLAQPFYPREFHDDIRNEIQKKYSIRSLCSIDRNDPGTWPQSKDVRYLDSKVFPVEGEIIVAGSLVGLISYSPQIKVNVIFDRALSISLTTLFNSLWDGAA